MRSVIAVLSLALLSLTSGECELCMDEAWAGNAGIGKGSR
jgi:hypothetical protein